MSFSAKVFSSNILPERVFQRLPSLDPDSLYIFGKLGKKIDTGA